MASHSVWSNYYIWVLPKMLYVLGAAWPYTASSLRRLLMCYIVHEVVKCVVVK